MIEFKVEDMACDHFLDRITKAINEVNPQTMVETNFAERKVVIKTRGGIEIEKFVDAMMAAG